MRLFLFALGVVVATAATDTAATAQNYPWCALYSGDFGGATNCGFSTWQQCQADVSGIGGFCEPNNTYVAPTLQSKRRHSQS
jgi:Protein of unknown function (DUF3551)